MLVVMGIEIRGHGRPEWIRLAVLCHIDLQNSTEADFQLDVPILVEIVVPYVLYDRICKVEISD